MTFERPLAGRQAMALPFFGWLAFIAASFAQATELQLTPDTCVRHPQHDKCELAVRVRFSEPQLRAFCLYLQPQQTALHCSEGHGEQEVTLQLVLRASRQLELRDDRRQLLASAPLKVAVYQPAPTRRRRGLGWNLL